MERRSDRNTRGSRNGETLHFGSFASPIGTIYVATDGDKVIALSITSESDAEFCKTLSARLKRRVSKSDATTKQAIRELREYFGGKREEFSLTPDISGFTPFQKRALKAAMSIPYGQTRTYGWLAARAGSPRASRAAGQVMARNEVPIIIPCHRVIDSSGGLCGFGGRLKALDIKRRLLELEGISI
jgi:methylated-DNA-[protein]-cysteine S-methyltransferase